jgi:hypothetical protein
VADSEQSGEGKQEAKAADTGIAQPATANQQEPHTTTGTGDTSGNPKPSQPILVQLVGGDDLEPFEEQTLTIARETLAISRRTYHIAIFGFLAALAAACFIGVQVAEMTDQTQILASQSESAAAGAAMGEINTRRQLDIAQQQANAAKDSVKAIQRQMRQDQRPWIKVNLGDSDASEKITWLTQVGGPLNVPIRFTNTGKTAAKHVRAMVFIEIIPKGKEFKLPVFPPPWGTISREEQRKLERRRKGMTEIQAGRIFAGGHASETVTRSEYVNGHAQPQLLSVPEANEIVRKESYVVMYGQVRYWDGFGIRHWSNFCIDFFMDGENANVTKCANYADDDNN